MPITIPCQLAHECTTSNTMYTRKWYERSASNLWKHSLTSDYFSSLLTYATLHITIWIHSRPVDIDCLNLKFINFPHIIVWHKKCQFSFAKSEKEVHLQHTVVHRIDRMIRAKKIFTLWNSGTQLKNKIREMQRNPSPRPPYYIIPPLKLFSISISQKLTLLTWI